MSEQNWEKYGEEIRRTVQDAVESRNYEKLNQMISDTVSQAANMVAKGVRAAADSAGGHYRGYKNYTTEPDLKMQEAKKQSAGVHYTNVRFAEPVKKKEALAFPIKAPSTAGAMVQTILGYLLGAVEFVWFMLMLALVMGTDAAFFLGPRIMAGTLAALAAPLSALGFWLGISGMKKFVRIGRFRDYAATLGNKEYCNVSELAEKTGKTVKTVVRDLEYMIRKRWFCQGHLDRQKTCLIATDKMYAQYRQLEEQKIQQLETEKQHEVPENGAKELPQELQKVITQGNVYIAKLRKCNDDIPGEEISEKISRIELLTEKIFARVIQNPESLDDISKLMDYYLPTTVKLLEAYAQMDAQPVGGENIDTAKKEIEMTLDTLNTAFEKLLDSLFQETAWDVSSDISVLNTLLAREGLKEDELKQKL